MNHNTGVRMNIFYYSKFSKMCTDLLKLMDNYGALNRFYLKCIDDMDPDKIPPALERVPTLIIAQMDKPLVAGDAVAWFNNMRPIFLQQNSENQNKVIMQQIIQNNMQSRGPKGYSEGEHSGFSDQYAYINIDEPLPKEFSAYVNGPDTNIIYTPPKEQNKLSKEEQERYMKESQNERLAQEEQFKSIMRKKQIDAVTDREKEKLIKEQMGIYDNKPS